jgi:putative two-component system response regulator
MSPFAMGDVDPLGEVAAGQSSDALVLVVDDDPISLSLAHAMLSPHYRVETALGGVSALERLAHGLNPDLILLDLMMPQMNGYEFMQRLRLRPHKVEIPVIFVTGRDDAEAEAQALALGAVDYVLKPIHVQILLARVHTHVELKMARDQLQGRNASLEAEVERRIAECVAVQNLSLRALSSLAETRDPETGGHLLRTKAYVQRLAELLRDHPRFAEVLRDEYINWLVLSAPLHDIGKVGLPDHVLLKPGKLTPEERLVMQRHAALGADAIAHAEADSGMRLDFLQVAKEMARHHHECWDGSGYPDRLAGDLIPLSARLMAVADVFDALVSRRVYKAPMDFELAYQIMAQGRDKQFDPDILDAFLSRYEDFTAIALRYSDDDQEVNRKFAMLRGTSTIN